MDWKTVGALLLTLSCAAAQASSPAKTEEPATKTDAPAQAEAQDSKRPVTASERRANAKKVRCVTEQVTGSRFAKRVCHTEEEWERTKEAGVEAVKHIQKSPIPLQSN